MIEQCRELWPPDGDRPRRWGAHAGGPGQAVVLRYYAILAPGEDLTEYPPTIELTWEDWLASHADYGLDVDGRLLEA